VSAARVCLWFTGERGGIVDNSKYLELVDLVGAMLKTIIGLLNKLTWILPPSVHERILARTGWRLVKVIDQETKKITLKWTQKYPLDVEGITASCTL